jgi:hypothetical protein
MALGLPELALTATFVSALGLAMGWAGPRLACSDSSEGDESKERAA